MMNSKKQATVSKPTLKRISLLLNQAKFNPNSPGVLNVIVNSGNPAYFETRALEFVSEATITRLAMHDPATYEYKLISAIRMLVIAVLKVQDGEA